MTHIHIKNLHVAYGSHTVIEGLDLEIPDGGIVAILGPSGCGKTTLLKSLNRLLDLHEDVTVRGSVLIDGEDIYAPGSDLLALRKKVGFVAQRPFPLPMSIHDNVAFGARLHELPTVADRAATSGTVERHLRRAGLWEEVKHRLDAPAKGLSIGQQQRLSLARALAVEPEVILADEPTSALDPLSVRIVEAQFRALRQDYTVLLVTHILRQARRLADYVIFLYDGHLVEHGPAETFFNAPVDPRTQAYLHGEIS
ncbi:phosphate ABC transporter ATP-binding protein [Holophaga foetida]|uniref:phosphate ABC transporter ATP-binding protein n=1 Tax=Holophaga foetida TaxID=35839 RepID=UPI0002473AD5|nr:phosphate ABC transporter ATP-binding protein [Holophaga foetida]